MEKDATSSPLTGSPNTSSKALNNATNFNTNNKTSNNAKNINLTTNTFEKKTNNNSNLNSCNATLSTTNNATLNNATTSPKSTFAEKVKNHGVEKKNAIIIEDANLHINDYILAVGQILGPENIIMASKIGQQKTRLFLASSELVTNFCNNHTSLKIKNCIVRVRPYISPHKKILITGVKPWVTNSDVHNILTANDIKTTDVLFCKNTVNNPRYGHILSERRYCFLSIEEKEDYELPSHVEMVDEGVFFKIYLQFEKLSCYICKGEHYTGRCNSNTNSNFQSASKSNASVSHNEISTTPALVHNNIENNTVILQDSNKDNSNTKSDSNSLKESSLNNNGNGDHSMDKIQTTPEQRRKTASEDEIAKSNSDDENEITKVNNKNATLDQEKVLTPTKVIPPTTETPTPIDETFEEVLSSKEKKKRKQNLKQGIKNTDDVSFDHQYSKESSRILRKKI